MRVMTICWVFSDPVTYGLCQPVQEQKGVLEHPKHPLATLLVTITVIIVHCQAMDLLIC